MEQTQEQMMETSQEIVEEEIKEEPVNEVAEEVSEENPVIDENKPNESIETVEKPTEEVNEERALILDMDVELRANRVVLNGYVNAVGRDSRIIVEGSQKFVEQIKPGTFARALGRGTKVDILLDHDTNRVLGDTNTTLRLIEDSIGLHAHAEIIDAEVVDKARNNMLRGWSFGFYPLSSYEEIRADGITRRIIDDLELVEVSIIDDREIPCYEGTSVDVRKMESSQMLEVRAVVEEEKEEIPEEYYNNYKERILRLQKGIEDNAES